MKFNINPQIFKSYPNLKVGAILIKGISNTRRISSVESLLRGVCAQRGKEFAEKDVHKEPMVEVWDSAYGNFGINPTKNPCSIAALLKRVKSGKDIPHINASVDLYNYFSLKFMLPIGGEDIDWLCGDLNLTFTLGGEAFRPIGSINVETALEGEVAYMDNGGITCRYWNHRECERTKFTEKTVNALILIEDLSKMHMDKFGEILKEISEGIVKYIGGRIEPYILTEENLSIDLGVEGRKNVNDSKIPQQEKAYFLEQELKKKTLAQAKKKSTKTSTSRTDLSFEDESLLMRKLKVALQNAVEKAFKIDEQEVKIEYPLESAHGDYASSIALKLAKELGLPPREIAEKIIQNFEKGDLVGKLEVAGPGFINFFISEKVLKDEIEKILKEKSKYGALSIGKNKNIVIDYSSPNIAKPLGVHHLLSTIIGQSLYNIFEKLGFKSIGVNHLGDWGTQFGKLIYAYRQWGKKELVEKNPTKELLKLYIKFHDESEAHSEIEDEARREFRKLEEGDKENRDLWKWFVDESIKDLEKTYKNLGGIKFDYYHGESFYEDKMEALLKDGKERGIFEKGEEGAYVVKYEDPNIVPFVVQKKDGATLYSTRDFATLKYRIETFKPEKLLYVVDVSQSLHFKQLFLGAERFPWYKGEATHVLFGRMSLKDKKMSTRKGNVVLLDEVLDEAKKRAKTVIEEKSPKLKEKAKTAKIIGCAAVKYNILSQNRTSDIVFDWDKMLSLEGNSAPYLQYSYARAKSILRKAELEKTKVENEKLPLDEEDYRKEVDSRIMALIRLFPRFSEQITFAAKEYKPNLLSNYLYEVAQKFNSFYNSVQVLNVDEPDRTYRLKIVEATAQILKNGLELLCVEVMEEM